MHDAVGRLCGVGSALPDLWRTRAPVGVEQGVDLDPCNAALGALSCIMHVVFNAWWCSARKTLELHGVADLHSTDCFIHAGALEQVEGTLQAPGLSQTAPVLIRSVWQCGRGYTELTERVTLLEFDFAGPLCSSQGRTSARYSFLLSQHCLAAWQDIVSQ